MFVTAIVPLSRGSRNETALRTQPLPDLGWRASTLIRYLDDNVRGLPP